MRLIKRSVMIVRPKSPYIKWANNLSGGYYISADDIATAFLIPSLFSIEGLPTTTMGWRYINADWDEIFREMLRRCEKTEWCWPQHRTRKMFGQWFTVEFYDWVVDAAVPE